MHLNRPYYSEEFGVFDLDSVHERKKRGMLRHLLQNEVLAVALIFEKKVTKHCFAPLTIDNLSVK